jgi:hypothetical protein
MHASLPRRRRQAHLRLSSRRRVLRPFMAEGTIHHDKYNRAAQDDQHPRGASEIQLSPDD